MPVATTDVPEVGQLVRVRGQQWVVAQVSSSTQPADPLAAVTDPEVVNLRDIHTAIDYAVLAAYGWSDLDPRIGHYQTKIGTRWTVSREARFELLDRLLEENLRRAALQGDAS